MLEDQDIAMDASATTHALTPKVTMEGQTPPAPKKEGSIYQVIPDPAK